MNEGKSIPSTCKGISAFPHSVHAPGLSKSTLCPLNDHQQQQLNCMQATLNILSQLLDDWDCQLLLQARNPLRLDQCDLNQFLIEQLLPPALISLKAFPQISLKSLLLIQIFQGRLSFSGSASSTALNPLCKYKFYLIQLISL